MSRQVRVPAGERRKIVGLLHRNLPARIVFAVETEDGSEPAGLLEERWSRWLPWPRESRTRPLAPLHDIEKTASQHLYSLHVLPESDVTVRFRSRHLRDVHIYGAIAAIALAGLVSVLAMLALGGP